MPEPASLRERLPVGDGDGDVENGAASHLAVELWRPPVPHDPELCCLYLHGFGSGQGGAKASFFRHHLLAEGIAFCSFDFQGHGESGGRLFDLSLSRNLCDVERVHTYLRGWGYARLLLLGSSMGGGTAMWYAARRPEDIAAAIHVAPAVDLASGLRAAAGPAGLERWQREGRLEFRNDLVVCDIGWSLIEDLDRYAVGELKNLYRTPTLFLQGKKDKTVPWRDVVDFVTTCPYEQLTLHLMADGDHRLVDRLDRLWALMRGFLAGRGLVGGVE